MLTGNEFWGMERHLSGITSGKTAAEKSAAATLHRLAAAGTFEAVALYIISKALLSMDYRGL
jgi:hypothetical protein